MVLDPEVLGRKEVVEVEEIRDLDPNSLFSLHRSPNTVIPLSTLGPGPFGSSLKAFMTTRGLYYRVVWELGKSNNEEAFILKTIKRVEV